MFIKRILVLKSDSENYSNQICHVEKLRDECEVYLKSNNLYFLKEDNIFSIISTEDKNYHISRFNKEENKFFFKLPNSFDLNQNISILIASYSQVQGIRLLAKGSTSKFFDIENLLTLERSKILSFLNAELNNQVEVKTISDVEVNNSNQINICTKSCEDCFFKQEYFKLLQETKLQSCEKESDFNIQQEELKSNDDTKDLEQKDEKSKEVEEVKDFYSQIEKTITTLFETNSTDEILEKAIEGSKFVKVEYQETEDYYSVGIIYEENQPRYICYALPCEAGTPPPENLAEFSQYLPLENQKGYYLMYQDAKTGENIVVGMV